MSDDNKNQTTEASAGPDAGSEPVTEPSEKESKPGGPTFKKSPDPLAGVKKGASDVMAGMEGKTVSMKLYVGTIIGVIVLMMLARCGG